MAQEKHPQTWVKQKLEEKNNDFRPIIRRISNTVKDRAKVAVK